MASSRFFVTNLPLDTTEAELRSIFKNYGPVTLVDLKTKENALEPDNLSVFAFVTLQINADDAQYCLNELKWQKLRGAKIKITLAKESFLERLKRERAENEGDVSNENVSSTDELLTTKSAEPFPESLQNSRRIFNEDDDSDGDDIAPELLITRKRAARSIQNGKIVIEEVGAEPLHVIEKQKKAKHSGNANKDTVADQKRKESLNKMKSQYQQKKSVIQEALSGESGGKTNKIKFSDAEEDDEDNNTDSKTKSKTQIFGEEDEEEDLNTLNINYGKKGDKLAELQSQRQNLDPRFKINENFVDDDGNLEKSTKEDEENEEDDERKWQLNILEQVVGYKLDTRTAAQKAAKNKKMLRYDPSKAEHEKFLRDKPTETSIEPKTKNKLKSTEKEEQTAEEKVNTVSKEVFYVVSDTLTEALKTRGEGFSLLNMFGQQATSAELEQREDQLRQLKNEKILVNKMSKTAASALNYDSSSSGEDDEDIPVSKKKTETTTENQKKTMDKNNKKTKANILLEMFFFTKSDERLKEGAKFFQFDQSNQIADEDYEPVRRRLNMLIKKKISKTRKNHIGAGRKSKHNKKKV